MREAAKTTGAVKSAIWWRAEENEGTGRLSNTSAFDLNRHWSKKKVEIFKYERDEDLFQLIQSFFFKTPKSSQHCFGRGKPLRRVVSHWMRQVTSNVTLQTLTQVLKEYSTKFGDLLELMDSWLMDNIQCLAGYSESFFSVFFLCFLSSLLLILMLLRW